MMGLVISLYLLPFDPPASYTPPKVAQGTAGTDGRFAFSLAQDAGARAEAAMTAIGEVNVLIRALSASRNWSGDLELALPVASDARLLLSLEGSMQPADLQEVSTERLLAAGTIIEDTPPSGFSCQDYPPHDGPRPLDASSDGSPPWDPWAACEEEAKSSGASSGYVTRHAKFVNLHLSKAMSGSVLWAKGRGSKVEEAFKVCYPLTGGCEAFHAGAMKVEEKSRSTQVTLNRKGSYHRTWKFQYRMKRYRRCLEWEWVNARNFGKCKKMKRAYAPYEWTWGTNDKKVLKGSPKMHRRYRVRLPAGVTIRTQSHENKVFGRGMGFFGVALSTQANYSEITQLSWTGRSGCRARFLYGRKSLPKRAKEIFAKSRGCG
jgi:hypothetical protein